MSQSGFNVFGLPEKLAHALARMKFTTPTPIQEQTIPLALQGRDVLGSAQTGTGKTGAFGVPVIAGLMARPDAAALIMTPTRELAGQVMAAIEPMIPTADIRTALLIGGEAMPRQMHQLRHNPRLIVGTPGRINDHLERGSLKLGHVRFLVLDETDRMLDMGFGVQIERILKHVPDERQTLLFSATLPHNITKLSGKYMRDPVRVAVGSTISPAAKIKQEVIPVTDADKYKKLLEQIDARKGSIIIFVKTKYGTEKLAAKLNKDNHRSDAIHGDLQQRRRERVIQNFRDKKYRILVATDVAARGLDIPHIAHVINYDMPQAPEDYIHRIGRTARAGAEGEAVSFLTSGDMQKWRAIERLMRGEDPNAPQPRGGRSGGPRGRKSYGPKRGGFRGADRHKDGRDDRPHRDRPRRDEHEPRREARQDAAAEGERAYAPKPWGGRAKDGKPAKSHDHKQAGRPADGHENKHGDRPAHERSFGDRPQRGSRDEKPRDDSRSHSDRPRKDHPHKSGKFGGKKYGGKGFGAGRFGDKPASKK